MRSRLLTLYLLIATGIPLLRCRNEQSNVFDVCVTLERCTGYVNDYQCQGAVNNAIDDRRLTTSALTRCANCLGSAHTPPPERNVRCDPDVGTGELELEAGFVCADLLRFRECDAACSEVSFVLRAHTSEFMRAEMCGFSAVCGGANAGESCRADTERSIVCLPFESQLDFDADIHACRECVMRPDGNWRLAETRAATCELMIEACGEVCRKVPSVSPTFTTASSVLEVCKADACFHDAPVAREGAGGAGPDAASGAGGQTGVETEVGAAGLAGAWGNDAEAGGAGGSSGADRAGAAGAAGAGDQLPCFEDVLRWLDDHAPDPAEPPAGAPDSAGGAGGARDSAGATGASGVAGQGGQSGSAEFPEATPTSRQERLEVCANCVVDQDCLAVEESCNQECAGIPLGVAR